MDHFGTDSSEYSVIFTSGCTASLKLVADHFVLHQSGDSDIKLQKPCGAFYYLDDNHTSVVGMREVFASRGATVRCVTEKEVPSCLFVTSHTDNPLTDTKLTTNSCHGNNLFVYPAQSNFSGRRYPLDWINTIKNSTEKYYYVLLDAASFVTTAKLDLREFPVDFVSISFYKLFGFPTGLGK